MNTEKSTQARLQNYEFIYEDNSTQFFASSLLLALLRAQNYRMFGDENGKLLEIILPNETRLKFDYHLFVNEFYKHQLLNESELIHLTTILKQRDKLAFEKLPLELRNKAKCIQAAAGFDVRIPITFHHWFGKHYAMYIGDTNTRLFYDEENVELD